MSEFLRRKNEQLVIELPEQRKPVVVTVVDIRGDKVRLGLENLPEEKVGSGDSSP
jgi:sRNA-binding carbon storage regulator CsrA